MEGQLLNTNVNNDSCWPHDEYITYVNSPPYFMINNRFCT
nr:MAG TPA: hypothetical protein [Microviridae sp.]